MRKTLYLKDDDYRLSFLYGNFVTLTNLDEQDWRRIEQQHLSPLHLSVHATDRALRAVLLGKNDVPDILAQIERLAAAGIEVHTQVVACPGLNDGPALHRTVQELAACYPTVQSIAVVPVGLTRFRFNGKAPQSVRAAIQVHEQPEWIHTNWERQPLWSEDSPPAPQRASADWGFCSRLGATTDVPLRCYQPDEAAFLLEHMQPYNDQYRREFGPGLVYSSDEFFLLCKQSLPPAAWYDDYPQYSNGVGMTREFLDAWHKAATYLPHSIVSPVNIALVCGTLISTTMQQVVDRLNTVSGLYVCLCPVENRFFGETVTVSGLLTGQDVVPVLRESGNTHAFLPSVMFDNQGMRTLDEYSPQQIEAESGVTVYIVDSPLELVEHMRRLAHMAQPMSNLVSAGRDDEHETCATHADPCST